MDVRKYGKVCWDKKRWTQLLKKSNGNFSPPFMPHVAEEMQAPQDQWNWQHGSLQFLQQEPLLFVVTLCVPFEMGFWYNFGCFSKVKIQKLSSTSWLSVWSNFFLRMLLVIELSFTKDLFLLHFFFFWQLLLRSQF